MEITNIRAKRAYLDTNIFIYLFEDHPKHQTKISELIRHLDEIDCELVTSEFTLAECLVKPFADDDKNSISVYQENLQSSDFLHVEPVSRDVLVNAALLRGKVGNKMPDSIHLATALLGDCDVFIGNDKGLKTTDQINSLILSDLE